MKKLSSKTQFFIIIVIVVATLIIVGMISFDEKVFSPLQLRLIILTMAISVCIFALVILRVMNKKNTALKLLNITLNDMRAQQTALNNHAIVSIADRNGVITYANDKFCSVSGYTREELIGHTHNILRSPNHSDAFFKQMWETISSGRPWHGEIRNKTKSSTYYWVNSTIVPVLDNAGKPYQYIAIRTEITHQKQIEKRLSRERHFLKGLLDALGDGVYVLNEKGLCTFVNPQAERMLRWSMAELRGKVIHNLIHANDSKGNKVLPNDCPITQTVHNSKIYRSETEIFTRRNGKPFPVSIVSVPMMQKDRYIGSVTIFKDITEQKERELQLTLATDQAKKANHAKSDFLSRMSHELRTPMNAILGFAQLLEINDELDSDDQDYVNEILKAGNHLLELINEVLDLSKIEAGRIDLSIESVGFLDVLNECEALISPLAEAKNISIYYDEEQAAKVALSCDRIRLKQIIVNLMSNAVKYNHKGGEIRIDVARTDNNYWRIKISDKGIGMPKERQNELFSPFSRLVSDQDEIEGSGIGLVISRRLTEMMHGSMSFESEEGEGSSFWFDLPDAKTTVVETFAQVTEPKTVLPNTSSQDTYTLLYMEDNPANLKLVERVINLQPGLRLVTATDPVVGIEVAEEVQPDLILLDIHMPGLTGLDVLKILKEKEAFSSTPFIAISANAMHSDIRQALDAGFDEYLTKPLNVDLFIRTINQYLGNL